MISQDEYDFGDYDDFVELEDYDGDIVYHGKDATWEDFDTELEAATESDERAELLASLASALNRDDVTDPNWNRIACAMLLSLTDEQIDAIKKTRSVVRVATAKANAAQEAGEPANAEVLVRNIFERIREDAGNDPVERLKAIDRYLDGDGIERLMALPSVREESARANEQLKSTLPTKHIIPNNKMTNKMRDIVDEGLISLYVDGRRHLTTRCMASYDDEGVELVGRQKFTEYDRSVMDAVISLYAYGDRSHVFTPAEVYRAMVNGTSTETPSSQQIRTIKASVEKLQRLFVKIDCTDEMRSRNAKLNGEDVEACKMSSHALAIRTIEVKAGGRTVTAYNVTDEPILYRYAKMMGQVATIPSKLLEIHGEDGSRLSNTEQRIVIRDYLIRRISAMKGKMGRKLSRRILYSTLFDAIDLDTTSRKRAQSARDYAEACLSCWVREGFIAGYETVRSGRQVLGVDIKLQQG